MSKDAKSNLQTILNLAEIKENDAARMLANAQKIMGENQTKLNELQVFLADYQKPSLTPVNAYQLQSTRQFLIQLNEVIKLQEQQLALSKCAMLKEKDNWLVHRVKSKSIEKIVEKRLLKEEKTKQKKEETELDEISAQFKTFF
jgi:flagellar FliJ protein